MGTDKALVEVAGRPLAARVGAALMGAGADPVLAVGGDAVVLGHHGLIPVADDHPGAGPVGGLATALRHASTDVVVVLACDLAAPRAGAVGAVVAALGQAPHADAAVPVLHGRPQPLHAAWRRSCLTAVRDAFADGHRSMHSVLERLVAVPVAGVDAGALADVDTATELEMLRLEERRRDGPH